MIYEYAHGGTTPIAALSDPGEANGCAVDPATGDLAVTNLLDFTNPYYGNNGDLAFYAASTGSPVMYYPGPAIRGFQFCGYDNSGDLYLSASDSYKAGNDLIRLPAGSTTFQVLNLKTALSGWSSVQWDGRHIAVSSMQTRKPISVYRLRISGGTAKVIGTTQLTSAKDNYAGQIVIQGDTVLGVGQYKRGYENAYLWPYPDGGEPRRTIMKAGDVKQVLWGLTVSLGQQR